MGLDTYSSAFGKESMTEHLKSEFTKAWEFIVDKTGSCDGGFVSGYLDTSTCGKMLNRATGKGVYGDDWSKEEVKQLYETANWNFSYSEDEEWAYWSARKFLEVCANNDLSIEFSW